MKRVGDRHSHVRIPQVRERCSVVQVHKPVDDRLRVDDHVDPAVRRPEQMVCLDHLEALVHERRAVDRDASAHVPGRVRERLLGRDAGQVRTAAEGATGRRQDKPLDRARRLGVHKLKERRVFRVNGDDACVRRLGERRHEIAADDQALLVGERQLDPPAQGDDRGTESG